MPSPTIHDLRLPLSAMPPAWPQRVDRDSLLAILAVAGLEATAGPLRLLKRSLDLRGRGEPHWQLRIEQREAAEPAHQPWRPNDRSADGRRVVIVGAGPAGTFAALALAEAGLHPIVVDRGEPVRPRRKAIADLSARGQLHDDSNYCFGEGGAGTFSDGKLYSRVKDRSGVRKILEILTHFGAPENILFDARPHIGSNRLPPLLVSLRQHLVARGVDYRWNCRVAGFEIDGGKLRGVITADGETIAGDAVVLATGHSARDIYQACRDDSVAMGAKPFALGLRIEHPQALIDEVQYGPWREQLGVGAAAYSIRQQVSIAGRDLGVYSFCMCPGGHIVPASTEPGHLVVNGMSLSKRASAFANSGLVVTIDDAELHRWARQQGRPGPDQDPSIGLDYQAAVEALAYRKGGGDFVAPAQRITDMVAGRASADLPACSYPRGLKSVDMAEVLPPTVHRAICQALPLFDRQLRGYFTGDAIVVATESRSSAPVRIERDRRSLESTSHPGLYPCGEGAGHAGGIVSAALDGLRVAAAIIDKAAN